MGAPLNAFFGGYPLEEIQAVQDSGPYMLESIRASLQARLEGRMMGGDSEVMRLVDEIVQQAVDAAWSAADSGH